MKAIDTNILVRFLVNDDEKQAKIVRVTFKKHEESKEILLIPILVIFETIWVLEAVYEVERREIIDSISDLMLLPILEFEHQAALRNFVISAQGTSCDLTDLLIAQCAIASGCKTTLTFDKKASKFDLFEKLV